MKAWASEGGREGAWPPWILKFSATKGIFFGFEWEKTNITTFGPPGKILEKSPSAPPLEKILPTPMNESKSFNVRPSRRQRHNFWPSEAFRLDMAVLN